jgi:hypothetical protein
MDHWAKGLPLSTSITYFPQPFAPFTQGLYQVPKFGLYPRRMIIMSCQLIIMALNLKMILYFNNVNISSSNLIRPSFFSNRIAGVRMTYLIPVSPLKMPNSMLPPWLFSIHKIRSRGDCDDGPGISSLPELIPMFSPGIFLAWRQAHCMPKRSFIALTSDCTCLKCIPYPGWMSSLMPLISSSTWGIVSVFLRTALMSSLI